MAGAIDLGSDPVFMELTDRQKLFVSEYVVDLEAKRAAREAGYATPGTMGSKLLKMPKVQKAVSILLEPVMTSASISKEAVLTQLARFGMCNLIPYLDRDGNLKVEPNKLPEDIQQCIVGFETINRFDQEGNILEQRWKIKLVDKLAAVTRMLEYLKLLKGDNEVNLMFDWNGFYDRGKQQPVDVIESTMRELEK